MEESIRHQEYMNSIYLIDQGKQAYLKQTRHELKQEGIQTMKKGCLSLLAYIRKEKNNNLQSITIPILKNYIDELVSFKNQLGEASTISQQNNIEVQEFVSTLNFEDQMIQEIKSLNELYNGALKIFVQFQIEETQAYCDENTTLKLKESIALPVKFPEIYKTMKNCSTLIYGPKGSGCSQIIRQLCSELKSILIIIDSKSILTIVNEFQIIQITHFLQRLTLYKPIIFLLKNVDEFSERQQIQNFFDKIGLKEIINNNFISQTIIAQTMYPWKLNSSIRRCFENRVFIDLPSQVERLSYIKSRLNKILNELENQNIQEFAQITKGYTILDLKNIFNQCEVQMSEKGLQVLKAKGEMERAKNSEIYQNSKLTYDDLLNILQVIKPSITEQQQNQFKDWNEQYNKS